LLPLSKCSRHGLLPQTPLFSFWRVLTKAQKAQEKVFIRLVKILLLVFADSIGDYRRYYMFKNLLFLEQMSAIVIANEVNFTKSLQSD